MNACDMSVMWWDGWGWGDLSELADAVQTAEVQLQEDDLQAKSQQ